ncbi:cyclin-I2 [Cavia porcellus]|uniref:cyclin-I2 n=1 Tax=Cavia porcellus TaxID=10141 RepID=UPI002FE1D041
MACSACILPCEPASPTLRALHAQPGPSLRRVRARGGAEPPAGSAAGLGGRRERPGDKSAAGRGGRSPMASGAPPAAGSGPRAPGAGAGAALRLGDAPDANPRWPPLRPPEPRRTPGPGRPPLPRRRANSEPASACAAPASPAQARAPPYPRALPCDPRGPLDERRLLAHLQVALEREARLWRGGSLQRPEVRDAYRGMAVWLLGLRSSLQFSSTTFTLALSIFGRLLLAREDAAGRAGQDRPGRASRPDCVPEQATAYALRCAVIACLRLAAKLNEEDESIPCITDFVQLCGSPYPASELRRMELSILKDLHWDLHIATPLDFLNIVSVRQLQSLP